MTADEMVVVLRGQNAELLAGSAGLRAENAALREQIAVLERRIAELEGKSGKEPPDFVKASRPKREGAKSERKAREKRHNQVRRREEPTRRVEHGLERCPECSYQLRGQSIDHRREVIELPTPQPVDVTEHQVLKRFCPRCKRWRSPKLDLSGVVLGQSRIGVRLVSLVAYLRSTLRLPLRLIQEYLATVHRCKLSEGEIVGLLEQVRKRTESVVEELKRQVQAAGVLHADETGWREDGVNGYVWVFATAGSKPIRYFERDPSRAQAVLARILGDGFKGHLVSDFYAGYNEYAGKHQRCWVHLLRDLHELKEKHEGDTEAVAWAQKVRALYDEAQAWLAEHTHPTQSEREAQYSQLVGRARELGLAHARDKTHPCGALCKRLLRHEDELFQFVLVEGLAPDNNLAERSVRPLVVARKISGGTRSSNGSKTRMVLATLFETWKARSLNPFEQCFSLLSSGVSPTTA
jgi:transposase